jgi:hypothetical protein
VHLREDRLDVGHELGPPLERDRPQDPPHEVLVDRSSSVLSAAPAAFPIAASSPAMKPVICSALA